jgi:hypothetical protein
MWPLVVPMYILPMKEMLLGNTMTTDMVCGLTHVYDNGVVNGPLYQYAVSAVNSNGEGGPVCTSSIHSIMCTRGANQIAVSHGNRQATITWDLLAVAPVYISYYLQIGIVFVNKNHEYNTNRNIDYKRHSTLSAQSCTICIDARPYPVQRTIQFHNQNISLPP